MVVAAHMLVIGEKAADLESARRLAETTLKSGKGLEQFRKLVINQGGDVTYVDQPEKFPVARVIRTVVSPRAGFLAEVDAQTIGETSVELGAGRARKEDPIDHSVGILVHHKVGDEVQAGDVLFTLHAANEAAFEAAEKRCLAACTWSNEPVDPLPLFYEVIGG